MATTVGIGFSQHLDAVTAAKEAAYVAKQQLAQSRIDVALFFNTVHYSPETFLPVLFEELLRTRVLGCSAAGIITPDRVLLRGIGVVAICSDHIRFETGCVHHLHLQDKISSGKELAKTTMSDFGVQQRKLFLCLTDGLLEGLTDLLAGVNSQFNGEILLAGAGASDNFLFEKTAQHYKDKSFNHSALGLLFGGRILLGVSSQHGWKPLGKPRIVTKSTGRTIREIDGQPADSPYREYFPAEAASLRSPKLGPIKILYPLGIRLPGKDNTLIRNILGVLDDGSVLCQDNVPEGSEVHLMIGNPESHLEAARKAATKVREQIGNKKPKVVIVFESLLRYRILRRFAEQVPNIIREVLGEDVPIIGMYSWGEFTSNNFIGNQVMVQNGNITIIAIG